MPKSKKISQKGYVTIVFIIFALVMALLIFPFRFPKKNLSTPDGFNYCKEFVPQEEAVSVSIPAGPGGGEGSYKLVKREVPVKPESFIPGLHVTEGENINIEDKTFQVLYPTPASGKSTPLVTRRGESEGINYADYGIVYLRHLKEDGSKFTVQSGKENLEVIDIYQDESKPPISEADEVINCLDEGAEAAVDPEVITPPQDGGALEQVQLEWFVVKQAKILPKAWWTPAGPEDAASPAP